jgi:hypothetical protein
MALPTIYRWTGALGLSNTDWQAASGTITNWVNTFDNSTSLTPGAGNDEGRFDSGTSITVSGGGRADVIEIVNGSPVTFSGNIDAGSLIDNTSPFALLVDGGSQLTIASGGGMSNDGIVDVIGLSGTGSLEVDSGGGFADTGLIIGDSPAGVGEVLVKGALGFDIVGPVSGEGNGELVIGQQGTGALDLESGSQFFSSTAILGQNAGSAGDLIVNDTTWGGGDLTIGAVGVGHATIGNGSSVLLTSVLVGANGELDLTGAAGSTGVADFDALNVAFGTVDLTGGGELIVGSATGSVGALDIAGVAMTALGTIKGNLIVDNGGTVQATQPIPGALKIDGNISGPGTIEPLMTLEVNGGVDAGVNIAFSPSVGEQVGDLVLDVPDAVDGTISGFGIGNTIDVQGSLYSTAIFTQGTGGNPGTLMLSGGTAAPLALTVSGDYSSDSFRATLGTSDTIVTLVPCFVAGTRIATSRGDVAVEQLRIGDKVLTPLDALRPIVWIGYRNIDCRRHPDPRKVWPVCIAAGAFGPDLPRCDLRLSPDHSVFVDGVLIPIKYLINGATIVQVPVDEVTYYHVQLPRHDVLLAEGLPAESYLDCGDRGNFGQSDGPITLHPDFSTRAVDAFHVWEAYGYAPLVVTGPVVAAVRARLLQQAAKLAVGLTRRPLPSPRARTMQHDRHDGWKVFGFKPDGLGQPPNGDHAGSEAPVGVVIIR